MSSSDWKGLAVMLLNSVSSTKFDEEDTLIDDETDLSLYFKTNQALSFLAQIVGDPLMDIAYQFAEQMLAHAQQSGNQSWQPNFIVLSVLNHSIDGISERKLRESFERIIDWIYQQVQSPSQKVQSVTASTISQLAESCPLLF